tara:strand:+ start:58 stop:834 length:777 start_codon:yes stop_codon:yes gene_type:complete
MDLEAKSLSCKFVEIPIAHRGFHDCGGLFGSGLTENSMSAFDAAIKNGFGIELDLQLTSDNVPIVFHDYNLKRLTGINKNVQDVTLQTLEKATLPNGEIIPTFSKVIKFVSGRVPILIEMKDQDGSLGPNVGVLEFEVAKILKSYSGPVAVMSFNPYSVLSFGKIFPKIPRGLVTEGFSKQSWPEVSEKRLEHLRLQKDIRQVGASFISHDFNDLHKFKIKNLSKSMVVLSWTVRSHIDMKIALKRAHNVTFEGFNPK